jgi:outer membrane lipoprotein-sorting protein
MKTLLCVLALALLATTAEAQTVDVAALSKELDELYRSKSSEGTMTMSIKTPDFERELTMKVYSRGMDDTLIRIMSPRKEAGTSTLKRGNEMWNYLPKIKKTIRIPPSMMMGSWMGSDFTNDDLVRESTWEDDYTVTLAKAPPAGQICLEYVPKPDAPVTWSKVVACVDEASHLPDTMDFYDEKDRKARTIAYADVRELGGRTVPTRMTLTPHTKEGHRTVVTYDEMEFDHELPENLFTITNLRRSE